MTASSGMQAKLKSGETVYGTFVSIPEPAIVEILGWSGYDFAVIDFEHTSMDTRTVLDMVRAAEASGVTPLARIGLRDLTTALRLVEIGIKGILAPHVTDREYLEQLQAVVRYRGAGGDRGIDPSTRSVRYGMDNVADKLGPDTEVMIFALVEDREGIDNIADIAEFDGLDGVMLGAADLARSYGQGADVGHPLVNEAIESASKVLRAAGIPSWRAAYTPDQVRGIREQGARIVSTPAVDALLISAAFRDQLRAVKGDDATVR
ncbi:aldolase/citrate lyase family protein [Rhodococcus sp. B10]|uniref:HpcH/HpaI aldolase family protein n=1 Tax=Rhodococcus sp. B10 TaxID=2695876 RepID=UPI001430BB4C|nr:aldolase/citrate lyase family protein [Rhodococcus sp. B10]NIL77868.1 5-keto-4-deoxy-D-glucarate aldolase [Rhodococcus sp. B10]